MGVVLSWAELAELSISILFSLLRRFSSYRVDQKQIVQVFANIFLSCWFSQHCIGKFPWGKKSQVAGSSSRETDICEHNCPSQNRKMVKENGGSLSFSAQKKGQE